jgi:hypothetical protein
MEVLTIRPILDTILNHLRKLWFVDDYLNLLIALNLNVEYSRRELGLKTEDYISKILINHNLQFFTKEIIRLNFTKFWNNVDFSKLNENFFIDNYDLIDLIKLKQLKKYYLNFECDYYFEDMPTYFSTRNFSEKFHAQFPSYKKLTICSGIYECYNDVEVLGQLCPNCKKNQCPRCKEIILPQLKLEHGCCEYCAGCTQFDYDSN